MKKWVRMAVCALVVGGTTTACVPDIEEPEVRLAGVRLAGLGLEGGLLYVRLNVVNPNRFALEASGLTYDVDLGEPGADGERWVDVTEGTFSEELRVEDEDSTVVEIPVEFSYRGLGGAIRSVLETGTVDYRVRGTVFLEEPLATEFPYRHEGTVAVLGGP
ncbi:MAG TPA: LEA type 2 family protein [Longimicrobiales bacterium]